MREEKNSFFTNFIIFLICIAGIYFVAFKILISEDVLINQMQAVIKTAFGRESEIMNISLSPIGNFKASNITVSSRDGFQNGTVGSIDIISSQIDLLSFFSRKLVLKDVHIDGFEISFGRKSFKNIQISKIDSFFRQIVNQNRLGQLMSNGIEIKNLIITQGNGVLNAKSQKIRFRNIIVKSKGINMSSAFDGDISFDIENSKMSSHVSANFAYNKREQALYIKNLKASSMPSLRGDIKINFYSNKTSAQYDMKINNADYRKLSDLLGKELLKNLNILADSKQMIISNR